MAVADMLVMKLLTSDLATRPGQKSGTRGKSDALQATVSVGVRICAPRFLMPKDGDGGARVQQGDLRRGHLGKTGHSLQENEVAEILKRPRRDRGDAVLLQPELSQLRQAGEQAVWDGGDPVFAQGEVGEGRNPLERGHVDHFDVVITQRAFAKEHGDGTGAQWERPSRQTTSTGSRLGRPR